MSSALCPSCEEVPKRRAVVREFRGGVLRDKRDAFPIKGRVLACPNCGEIHATFDAEKGVHETNGAEYYGEFSDSHATALEADPNIEVVKVTDGEFGLDQGTKHVQFRLATDAESE